MLPQMSSKKILISEQKINNIINAEQIKNVKENVKQILLKDIYIAISKYSDSLMIIINQTDNMGSIYKAQMTGQSLPRAQQDEFEDDYQNMNNNQIGKSQKIYQIKCLFGSTEIEFYEILIRKVLQLCYEQIKIDPTHFILFNISLPLKFKQWEHYQVNYYQSIINKLQIMLKQVC